VTTYSRPLDKADRDTVNGILAELDGPKTPDKAALNRLLDHLPLREDAKPGIRNRVATVVRSRTAGFTPQLFERRLLERQLKKG
jgi:hypothetical protein